MSDDSSNVTLVFFGLLGLGSLIGYLVRRDRSTRKKLRKAKVYRIRDLPEGVTGRIVGRVRSVPEPLEAPLTGRPCVYYSVTVLRHHYYYGKSDYVPETVANEAYGVSFVIEDDTGRAIIDASPSEIALDYDGGQIPVTNFNTPHGSAFLQRQPGAKLTDTFCEGVIGIGEWIAVLGTCVREPDPDAEPTDDAYRGVQPTRIRLTGSRQHPLLISDSPETTVLDWKPPELPPRT